MQAFTAAAPFLLAFALAFAVTFADYVTSNFPSTLCLAVRNRWLWVYAAIYGGFGVVAFIAYPELFGPSAVDAAKPASVFSMQNVWMRAATIGMTIKTVMRMKFFEIPGGAGNAVPVGIVTFLQPFEPLLVREILLKQSDLTSSLIDPAAVAYGPLAAALPRALNGIPASIAPAMRTAMATDLRAAPTINDLLQTYLAYAGCHLFRKAFP